MAAGKVFIGVPDTGAEPGDKLGKLCDVLQLRTTASENDATIQPLRYPGSICFRWYTT